jgi:two-component system chemotaxis response regulator CheY
LASIRPNGDAARSAAEPSHILIVEPDSDTRALYRHALESAGHSVAESPDGRDALVRALVRPPRLVITETQLPMVDGYALCEVLRVDQATRTLPILVVTSESRWDKIQLARSAGASAVLVKPVQLDLMLAEIARLLTATSGACAETARRGGQTTPGVSSEANDVSGPGRSSRRSTRSKSHARFDTMAPPSTPPALYCPSCDHLLTYQYSHVGGVSSRYPEQWDYFVCPGSCGPFEYRQRTRKLRQALQASVRNARAS